MRDKLRLFGVFFKIGAFTFGGGYAMIPLIQREAVEKYGWISDEDMLDIVSVAESTPGPIAINSATFVGARVAGFWGAAAATLGVVLPSFIAILLLGSLLDSFDNLLPVKYAFNGVKAGVLALIAGALVKLLKGIKKGAFEWAIMALAFAAVGIMDINSVPVLMLCAAAGIIKMLVGGGIWRR